MALDNTGTHTHTHTHPLSAKLPTMKCNIWPMVPSSVGRLQSELLAQDY